MKSKLKSSAVLAASAIATMGAAVDASAQQANPWVFTGGASTTALSYKNAINRDSVAETGLVVDANSALEGGIGGGISRSTVKNKNGVATLNQTNKHLSGRTYQIQGMDGGKMTYRLDYLSADNNDSTRLTDDVKAWAPKLSYVNAKGDLILDFEYATTKYQQSLNVKQFAPKITWAVNEMYDYLSLKAVSQKLNNGSGDPGRTMGMSGTTSLEASWTHFNAKSSEQWIPSSYTVTAMTGKRMYYVNTDAGSISNLNHYTGQSLSFGSNWTLAKDLFLSAMVGSGKHTEADTRPASVSIPNPIPGLPPLTRTPPPFNSYSSTFINVGINAVF